MTSPFLFISHLIGGAVGSSLLLSLAIALCAFFLEDLTIIIVGVLAADGTVPFWLSFISIYIGIVIADAVLYALGSLARTHPRLAKYIDHDFTAPFRAWLENRYAFTVFSGHFILGLRFATYVASGFFQYPLRTYIPMAMLSGLLVETVLFTVSYWFGSITAGWVSHVRWGIAGVFILALFFIARHNYHRYKATQATLGIAGDTHTT